MGYTNVMLYRQGLTGWARAGNPLVALVSYPKIKIPLVSADNLSNKLANYMILDTRPPDHFSKGHVKGAVNINLEVLHEELNALPKDRSIALVDHKGKTGLVAGRFLASKGFTNVARLDGGFNAWAKTGQPFDRGN